MEIDMVTTLSNLIVFSVFIVCVGILSAVFAKRGKKLTWVIFAAGELLTFLSLNLEQKAMMKKLGGVNHFWDIKLMIFLFFTIFFVWLIGFVQKNYQQ